MRRRCRIEAFRHCFDLCVEVPTAYFCIFQRASSLPLHPRRLLHAPIPSPHNPGRVVNLSQVESYQALVILVSKHVDREQLKVRCCARPCSLHIISAMCERCRLSNLVRIAECSRYFIGIVRESMYASSAAKTTSRAVRRRPRAPALHWLQLRLTRPRTWLSESTGEREPRARVILLIGLTFVSQFFARRAPIGELKMKAGQRSLGGHCPGLPRSSKEPLERVEERRQAPPLGACGL